MERDMTTETASQQAARSVSGGGSASLDAAEVARFEAIAAEWWDQAGKFRPLHQIGPARLQFVRDQLLGHFKRPAGLRPLTGLSILDIGCGGGLVSEPLARLGAAVTGIDPGATNIAVAKRHAAGAGLAIDYRSATAETLVTEARAFDAVVCLEVVEHVPDAAAFVATCAALVRPGGLLVMSTLNRTLKSYALAIIGAEYVLRWLPAGTHDWHRFITPEELARHFASAGLARPTFKGMIYSPFSDAWSLADDLDVNYLAAAAKA